MGAENKASSRAIKNPHEPNKSSTFGTVTADLPCQAVPRRSSHLGVLQEKVRRILGQEPALRQLFNQNVICFPTHITWMTRTGEMQHDQICSPHSSPPMRLQPILTIKSSQTRQLSISPHVVK